VTPARRAEIITGVEAALATEGAVLVGREHIEALLLWFASSPPGLTVMDAVVAGYCVGGAGDVWLMHPPGRPGGGGTHRSQADAWRAALHHMAAAQ